MKIKNNLVFFHYDNYIKPTGLWLHSESKNYYEVYVVRT